MDRRFANILDECLERVLVNGETVEQCLLSYPEQALELKPLLELALASKQCLEIKPRPEFRASARYQFRSALAVAAGKKNRISLTWLPRWAPVTTLVIGLLTVAGGTVAAAGYSMPDSPLYPVKIAAEQVQMQLTPSEEKKTELNIKLADRRVAEIVYEAGKGDSRQIEALTRRLDSRLESLAGLVSSGQAAKVAKVDAPTPMLAPTPVPAPTPTPAVAPPASSPSIRVPEATTPSSDGTFSQDGKEDNREVSSKSTERMKLRAALAQYAVNHPAILRALLQNAPESSKPALRQAIAVLVSRYEKALEALDKDD